MENINDIPKHFKEQAIESEVMKVFLDNTFPRVIRYEMKDSKEIVSGQKDFIYDVELNNECYKPYRVTFSRIGTGNEEAISEEAISEEAVSEEAVSEEAVSEEAVSEEAVSEEAVSEEAACKTARYIMEFNMIQTVITVQFEVQSNILCMNITDIEENGDFIVKSIGFPNHCLVSVENTLPNAAEASVWTDGGFNKIWEEFYKLSDGNVPQVVRPRTYSIINGGNFAVTIANNVIDGTARIMLLNDGSRSTIWNGKWIYRELDSETEELPWSKVIICGDENSDGIVDWQDGAIGYRKNMAIPFGGEEIKSNMSYISYNIGSLVQNPFLRALDNAKKMYCYTDGFGQMIMCKGYQAEGHDDSHPDCGGHIGIRQGGKKDFNTLIEAGRDYNLKIGVHINVTEFHADAFEVNDASLVKPYKCGWNWLDQSYIVDKHKDITTGELYRRLDILKADAPGLKWVYVDVYSGAGWEAHKLYKKLSGNGWLAGTEYSGPMEQGIAWVHWGTDPYYPAEGNNSKIMRFIKNHVQDTFPDSELLKGNKLLGVGGWYGHHSIWEGVEMFYNRVLPTKYMQYFPIIKWTDDRIDFEGNVYSVKENGKVSIYKDGRKVAVMQAMTDKPEKPDKQDDPNKQDNQDNPDKQNKPEVSESLIFAPWDPINEDKIYHWNPTGGESAWDLPLSWAGVDTVKLYRLTDTGKEYVSEIKASDEKINIYAEAKTPYILFKGEAIVPENKDMKWGQGGYVRDPGFDSRSFDIWKKESTWHDTSHINIKEDTDSDSRKGNTYLEICGNNGADALVSQRISGLVPGKTYTASVWVKTSRGRKAHIGVRDYGGPEVSNWVDRTDVKQYGEAVKYADDYYQHLKVVFDVPKQIAGSDIALNGEYAAIRDNDLISGKVAENLPYEANGGGIVKIKPTADAVIYLKADKGSVESSIQFDDVRVWENPGKTPVPQSSVLYEDFENVDEGWGPFVLSCDSSVRTHIAEKKEGSKQLQHFVINGRYSLKSNMEEDLTGEILRTQQSTLKLKPNTVYCLSFNYRYDKNIHSDTITDKMYGIAIRTTDGGEKNEKLNIKLPADQEYFSCTFKTGGYVDYYLAVDKLEKGYGILLLDDISIVEVIR